MRRVLISLALATPLCLVVIVAAQGAEGISNGGFETGGDGWTADLNAVFCTTASCAPDTARAGTGWARIAGGSYDTGNRVGQISRQVTIPSAPATLSLYLRFKPPSSGSSFDKFTVFIDDNVPLKTVDLSGSGATAYTLVTVDLSPYTGTHTLKLHGQSMVLAGTYGAFDVDDVSLTYPDPPTTSTTTGTETTTTTTTSTTSTTTTTTPDTPPATCAGRTATITGTDATEIVTGSPNADVILAGGGDDVVRAGAGDDVACGGTGNDELKGASGKDRLLGEEGRDKLNGGGGKGDRCDGGPSRDKASQSCEKSKRL